MIKKIYSPLGDRHIVGSYYITIFQTATASTFPYYPPTIPLLLLLLLPPPRHRFCVVFYVQYAAFYIVNELDILVLWCYSDAHVVSHQSMTHSFLGLPPFFNFHISFPGR